MGIRDSSLTILAASERDHRAFQARITHVWTLRDDFIVRLQQCADTAQIAKAVGKDFNKRK